MRSFMTAGALLMSFFVAGASASAYCLNKNDQSTPPFMAWTPLPGSYRISDTLTDAAMLAAIDAAFATWSSVPCTTLEAQPFVQGQSFSLSSVEFQHDQPYLYIFWHTSPWEKFENPSNPSQPYISYTFIYWNKTGGIEGASIAINAAAYKWNATGGDGSTFDIQNELTHLIGTVIGLAKIPDAGHAMTSALKYGDTSKRTLSEDDKNAVTYLYKGTSCSEPPQPDPTTGCSTGTAPPGDGSTTTSDGGGTVIPSDGGTTTVQDGKVTIYTEAGVPITGYTEAGVPITSDSGSSSNGKSEEGEDDGCGCMVGQHEEGGLIFWVLVGLFLLGRRRWNRRA